MSAAEAGPAAAVTEPGKCNRIVYIGRDKHVIEHKWRLNGGVGGEVRLETKLVDRKNPNRTSNKMLAAIANTEEALSVKAIEMVNSIRKKRRDRFLKAQRGAGGSSSSSGPRRNADMELADPVIEALRGGGRTRSGVATNKPDEQEVRQG